MRFPVYPEYKDSGVAWLGVIPEHWEFTPLKVRLTRNDGGVWGDDFDDEGTVVLRSTEQTADGRWIIADPARRKLTVSERAGSLLESGDIVITKSSGSSLHIGKTSLVTDEVALLGCCYSNFMQRLRASAGTEPKYVYYLLNSELGRAQFDYLSNTTTGLANLTKGMIGGLLFAWPSFPEQRAIAAFLDRETARIDALIAKKQRLIELLQEKRAALISHAVTQGLNPAAPRKDSGIPWLGQIPAHWEVTKLKFATSRIVDCPHETPVYDPDGGYAVIRTADLVPGTLDLSNAYRVDQGEFQKRIRREPLKPLDIVYGREGERWGYAALVPGSQAVCLGQRMMQFRVACKFEPRFMMWQLNADHVYQQGAVETTGATSPHVNVETIKNYWLCAPPYSEQAKIADFIEQQASLMEETAMKASDAVGCLQEYRASLIAHAVTGKIDVRHVRSAEIPETA